MSIIGITGNLASGKNTFCNLIANSGQKKATIINVDLFIKDAMLDYRSKLQKYEKEMCLDANGNWIMKEVTSRPELSRSVWAFVREYANKKIESEFRAIPKDTEITLINYAALPDLDAWGLCKRRIIISADETTRIARLRADGKTPFTLGCKYERLPTQSGYTIETIENNGTMQEFEDKVLGLNL